MDVVHHISGWDILWWIPDAFVIVVAVDVVASAWAGIAVAIAFGFPVATDGVGWEIGVFGSTVEGELSGNVEGVFAIDE